MSGAWTGAHTRYLLAETAVGVVVTIVLSCAFAALVFGSAAPVDAADPALQFDALPQAVIVAFMGSLVPTLIARRRLRAGRVASVDRPHRWPRAAVLRGAAIALLVGLPMAGLHALVMTGLPGVQLSLVALLAFKACFGVAVALIATPLAVTLALRDGIGPLAAAPGR